jgi:hypothetical protein
MAKRLPAFENSMKHFWMPFSYSSFVVSKTPELRGLISFKIISLPDMEYRSSNAM